MRSGLKAWEKKRARGIAVLTQIGEMSINISAPLMLSDLCPWDRLAQRAGRLARFREAHSRRASSTLPIHTARACCTLLPTVSSIEGKAGTAGPPLLDTDRCLDALTANVSLWKSRPRTFSSAKWTRSIPSPRAGHRRPEQRAPPDEMMRQNWMIVQATEAREDEADVEGQWKSRDIPPQKTLLVRSRTTSAGGGQGMRILRYERHGAGWTS